MAIVEYSIITRMILDTESGISRCLSSEAYQEDIYDIDYKVSMRYHQKATVFGCYIQLINSPNPYCWLVNNHLYFNKSAQEVFLSIFGGIGGVLVLFRNYHDVLCPFLSSGGKGRKLYKYYPNDGFMILPSKTSEQLSRFGVIFLLEEFFDEFKDTTVGFRLISKAQAVSYDLSIEAKNFLDLVNKKHRSKRIRKERSTHMRDNREQEKLRKIEGQLEDSCDNPRNDAVFRAEEEEVGSGGVDFRELYGESDSNDYDCEIDEEEEFFI